MNRLEYANAICSKLNQVDTVSVALCNNFLKFRYEMIYNSHLWKDSLKNVATSLTDTTHGVLAFPAGVDRIISIRGNGTHLINPFDSAQAFQLDPQALERTGDPYSWEEYSDTATSPPTRSLRFVPIPTVATALIIVGKMEVDALSSDSSVPRLRNVDNCLMAYAMGDMLERQRQFEKAQLKFSEASSLLQSLIDLETKQAGNLPRVIPMCEPVFSLDDCDNWLRR